MFWKNIRYITRSFDIAQFSATVVAEKLRHKFFFKKKTHLDQKHLEKHTRQFDKPIYGLKKHKKTISKLENQSETKTLTKLMYVFLSNFKVKKKNTRYELFSLNETIWHNYWPFFSRNSCQHKFLSPVLDSSDFLSPLFQTRNHKIKIIIIKFWIKIDFPLYFGKWRDQNL